jgi:hypothetical protein
MSDYLLTTKDVRKQLPLVDNVYVAVMNGNMCYSVRISKDQTREYLRHIDQAFHGNIAELDVVGLGFVEGRDLHLGGL